MRDTGRLAIVFLALASSCLATTTWDVVANFNSPNNGSASSVFSYGSGTTPGAFATMSTNTQNCFGTPTYCDTSGGSFPTTAAFIWNGTAGNIAPSGSTSQPNTEVYIDPQNSGSILRFTAPVTGVYAVSGTFFALDSSHHTTDGSVYANGVLKMGPSALTTFGTTASINLSGLSLTAGQTIDFIVDDSPSDASNDATGLSATITNTVPEPGSFALVGGALGLAGLLRLRGRGARVAR